MQTSDSSLYDSASGETLLLENIDIQGRKNDLRQILKLLTLSKSGDPKAVLVSGDPGIGKTALIDAFVGIVRKGLFCRVIDLRGQRLESAQDLYVAMIDALRADANDILMEGLEAVNEITQELGLCWERQDLVRAVALVKLQESIGGKEALRQEQLVKAIRSSVPTIKKLRPSVNETIERLVTLIVNPWLTVATALLNPFSPQLQEAVQLAQRIKEQPTALTLTMTASAPALGTSAAERKALRRGAAALPETSGADNLANGVDALYPPTAPAANGDGEAPLVEMEVGTDETAQPVTVSTALTTIPNQGADALPSQLSVEGLAQHLLEVFHFINKAIQTMDSAVLIVMDDWDKTTALPEARREEMKEFLSVFLRDVTYRKNYHLMLSLCCRSEGESYSLGGTLYNLFRSKLLLSGLNSATRTRLFMEPLRKADIKVDDAVLQDIFTLTKGNPFWLLKMQHYMRERAQSNFVTRITPDFYRKLGIEYLLDLLEFSFTRVKLAFLHEEEALNKIIAALLKHFGDASFSVAEAIKELGASQGFSEDTVYEVLRNLYNYDFLTEGKREATGEDPRYRIQSRQVFDFLRMKTKAIQTDVSTDEKLGYLKKIIPLSVKSGELNREKTLEVLSLSQTLGNDEMVQFLEETFLEYLSDPKAIVRVTALNNIATIDSERSFNAILNCLTDDNAMVREYAARNLSFLAKRTATPQFHTRIVEALIACIDDESEVVRAEVYATLSKYNWRHDLVSVFLKGMTDGFDAVRLIAIQNLVEIETNSPLVKTSLLDATRDENPEIRKMACVGIQKYPDNQTIETLARLLREDGEAGVRALAAESLSRMEEKRALDVLVEALHNDPTEDVKLAVLRALGKRRGWPIEELLLNTLSMIGDKSPVLLWACVQSMGSVAGTERSVEALTNLKNRLNNDIVLIAVQVSLKKIAARMDELRQLERQLDAAPAHRVQQAPYEDLPVLEDDRVDTDPQLLADGL